MVSGSNFLGTFHTFIKQIDVSDLAAYERNRHITGLDMAFSL